jgi:hypothetical protein
VQSFSTIFRRIHHLTTRGHAGRDSRWLKVAGAAVKVSLTLLRDEASQHGESLAIARVFAFYSGLSPTKLSFSSHNTRITKRVLPRRARAQARGNLPRFTGCECWCHRVVQAVLSPGEAMQKPLLNVISRFFPRMQRKIRKCAVSF